MSARMETPVMVGHGSPLVYVPGMDGTGLLFYRQIDALARDFRVVTYRLRDDAATMHVLLEQLAEVCASASPTGEPAILVGESFGGALALSFALAHPARVRALVILNSFPYFRPQWRLRLARLGIALIPWGAMRLVRRVTAHRLHSTFTPRAELEAFHRLTAQARKRGYLGRLGILRRYDIRDALPSLRVPTLFLAADQDHLIPSVDQARLMASLVPGATLRVLRGHGHSCFLADDVDVAAMLRDWLPAHAAPRAPSGIG